MNLENHYTILYNESIEKIRSSNYSIDERIDSTDDDRRGLTLLLRPDDAVKNEIQHFLSELKLIEPRQYYYRDSDIHVTVMGIVSCYSGFCLSQINLDDYIQLVQESLQGCGSFEIEFRGITASPSCLMVQGFLKDNTLNEIRTNLRNNFKHSDLEQSIDKRYTIHTAHSTIFRIREKLADKEGFLKLADANRNRYFGSFTADTVELVYNDWYQRIENVQTLHRFVLKSD